MGGFGLGAPAGVLCLSAGAFNVGYRGLLTACVL